MQASERAAVELKLAKLSDDMLDVQNNVEEMHKAVKQLPGRLADNGSGGGAWEDVVTDVSFEKKGPGLGVVSVRRNQARCAAYISGRHIRQTYKADINQARCAAYTCVCVCVFPCVCACTSRSLSLALALSLSLSLSRSLALALARSRSLSLEVRMMNKCRGTVAAANPTAGTAEVAEVPNCAK